MKERYYLYIYSVDMTGTHYLYKGKLFFDKNIAIDEAKRFCDIPGYHVQLVECDTNKVIYER